MPIHLSKGTLYSWNTTITSGYRTTLYKVMLHFRERRHDLFSSNSLPKKQRRTWKDYMWTAEHSWIICYDLLKALLCKGNLASNRKLFCAPHWHRGNALVYKTKIVQTMGSKDTADLQEVIFLVSFKNFCIPAFSADSASFKECGVVFNRNTQLDTILHHLKTSVWTTSNATRKKNMKKFTIRKKALLALVHWEECCI